MEFFLYDWVRCFALQNIFIAGALSFVLYWLRFYREKFSMNKSILKDLSV